MHYTHIGTVSARPPRDDQLRGLDQILARIVQLPDGQAIILQPA